ncbi:MAG: TlpA family protein disulfide reductase [Mucilaginibacter sp.]
MKKYFVVFILALSLLSALTVKGQRFAPIVKPEAILKNMDALMNYYNAHLQFSGDFLAYDMNGKPISKYQLLKQTAAGGYLPLQVATKSGVLAYQLYKLPASTVEDVRVMLKQIGYTDYGIFQTVGKPFPPFHYVDLNGNVITSANTKGKIMVLKAWFIGCVPCVNEFPELNKLVEKYKSRKDILFVSISSDSRSKLQAFMKQKKFEYAVVPMPANYMQDTLRVAGYPAHWVINKQGVVVSMSYDKSEMMAALYKEAEKK